MTEPDPPLDPGAPPPYAPQPGYQGLPAYGGPPGGYYPATARNGLGTAGFVCGIAAVVLCWTIVGGLILGILGLVFGVIGKRRADRGEATNGGFALAGAITGGIGLLLTIALIALGAVFFVHHKSDLRNLRDCLDRAQTQPQRDQCERDFRNAVTG